MIEESERNGPRKIAADLGDFAKGARERPKAIA